MRGSQSGCGDQIVGHLGQLCRTAAPGPESETFYTPCNPHNCIHSSSPPSGGRSLCSWDENLYSLPRNRTGNVDWRNVLWLSKMSYLNIHVILRKSRDKKERHPIPEGLVPEETVWGPEAEGSVRNWIVSLEKVWEHMHRLLLWNWIWASGVLKIRLEIYPLRRLNCWMDR